MHAASIEDMFLPNTGCCFVLCQGPKHYQRYWTASEISLTRNETLQLLYCIWIWYYSKHDFSVSWNWTISMSFTVSSSYVGSAFIIKFVVFRKCQFIPKSTTPLCMAVLLVHPKIMPAAKQAALRQNMKLIFKNFNHYVLISLNVYVTSYAKSSLSKSNFHVILVYWLVFWNIVKQPSADAQELNNSPIENIK